MYNNRWGDGVFSLLTWFDFKKVNEARIMVVGAGALGNEVLKNLALFGFGNIFIVDLDNIEETNLCRSVLFRQEDAASCRSKAEVAASRVKEINPLINVQYIHGNIISDVGLGIIRKMDIVIGCLDNRLARYYINKHCFRVNKSWIDGGIENLEGNVRIFKPGQNCYECGLSDFELGLLGQRTGCPDIAKINITQGRVATTPVSSSIIGAIQVQEAMKLIHGYDESSSTVSCDTLVGKMLKYDGMHLSFKNFLMSNYNDDCLSHEVWDPVIESAELSAEMKISEAISVLRKKLNANEVTIYMMNNRFIHKLFPEHSEKEHVANLPESKIAEYIEETIDKKPSERVFQKYYENIDREFPLQDLTLREIGIPHFDIIKVGTGNSTHFVELTGDKGLYGF